MDRTNSVTSQKKARTMGKFLCMMMVGAVYGGAGTAQVESRSTVAASPAGQDAEQKIQSAMNKTLAIMNDGAKTDQDKKSAFSKVLDQHVNFDLIAYLAAPKEVQAAWKKGGLSAADKQRYKDLVRQNIQSSYYYLLHRHAANSAAKVVRTAVNPKTIDVFVQAHNAETKQSAQLKWTLRQGKVMDLAVNNASMLSAKRTEYRNLMRSQGRSQNAVASFLKALGDLVGRLSRSQS